MLEGGEREHKLHKYIYALLQSDEGSGEEVQDHEHFTEDVATRCNSRKNSSTASRMTQPLHMHRQTKSFCCLPSITTKVPTYTLLEHLALCFTFVIRSSRRKKKKKEIYAEENVKSKPELLERRSHTSATMETAAVSMGLSPATG